MCKFYKEFNVVRIQECCNGISEWENIKLGTEMMLSTALSERNEHHHSGLGTENQVRVRLKSNNALLGYLPKEEAKDLAVFLDMGWQDVFLTKICKKDNETSYDKRFSVAVFIKKYPLVSGEKFSDNVLIIKHQ